MTRPIMNAAELAQARTGAHGRDYSRSDDGYSDMEVAATEGWRAIAGWGRDGWDLGDWPYVVISVRTHRWCEVPLCGRTLTPSEMLSIDSDYDFVEHDGHTIRSTRRYQMRQTCEGDTTEYSFATTDDRDAAIDYLFVWYGISKGHEEWTAAGLYQAWGPDGKLLYSARERLDAGTLEVPERFRGPYSAARPTTEETTPSR